MALAESRGRTVRRVAEGAKCIIGRGVRVRGARPLQRSGVGAMVVDYLELVDRRRAAAADRYGCFLVASEEEYSKACLEDARARGGAPGAWATRDGCERVLADLQAKRYEYWDLGDAERHFNAERNAEVVVSAQQFYAKRLTEPDVTWSVRDHQCINQIVATRLFDGATRLTG